MRDETGYLWRGHGWKSLSAITRAITAASTTRSSTVLRVHSDMSCLASVLTLSLSKLVVRRSITTSDVGAVISATAQSSISVWSSARSVAPSAEGNQQGNWL